MLNLKMLNAFALGFYLDYFDWAHAGAPFSLPPQERWFLLDQLDLQLLICMEELKKRHYHAAQPQHSAKYFEIKCFTFIVVYLGKDSSLFVKFWQFFFRQYVGCDHLNERKTSSI